MQALIIKVKPVEFKTIKACSRIVSKVYRFDNERVHIEKRIAPPGYNTIYGYLLKQLDRKGGRHRGQYR